MPEPREWSVPYTLREAWNKAMVEECERFRVLVGEIDAALVSAECSLNHKAPVRNRALERIRKVVDKYREERG